MANELVSRPQFAKLGDLLIKNPQYGLTATSADAGNIHYLRISDITDDGMLKPDEFRFVNIEGKEFKKFKLENDDLLIARSGSVGRSFLFRNTGKQAVFASYLIRFKLNKNKVIPRYVFYYTMSPNFKAFIKRKKKTVAQPNINAKEFSEAEVPIFPIPTQQKIATVLERTHQLKRKRVQANQMTTKILLAVFLQMFADPATNSKGWEMARIGDFATVWSGGTPSRRVKEYFEGDIPWVTTTQANDYVVNSALQTITRLGLEKSNAKLCPEQTVLVAMIGAGKTRGMTTILNIEAATNQNFAAILPSARVHPFYLWQLLRLSYERLRSLGRGVNQPALNLDIVRSIDVALPPLEIQKQFADIVERVLVLKDKQGLSEIHISKLYDSVLSKAFSGELVR